MGWVRWIHLVKVSLENRRLDGLQEFGNRNILKKKLLPNSPWSTIVLKKPDNFIALFSRITTKEIFQLKDMQLGAIIFHGSPLNLSNYYLKRNAVLSDREIN